MASLGACAAASAMLVIALAPTAPAQAAESTGLVAMAQITRSDGVTLFTASGLFEDQAACEMSFNGFPEGFRRAAEESGLKAAFTTKTCAAQVPRGTEFDALWNGGPSEHYILFLQPFRLMIAATKGNLDTERNFCEIFRNQFMAMGATDVRCDPPRPK